MKATGTLNTKIVVRKLQGSGRAFQFMLLCGFTPALTHTNADYVETLSPNHLLTQGEIDAHVAKFVALSNAADARNITNEAVQKKLDRLFAVEADDELDVEGGRFGEMRIGEYLPA